MVELTPVAVEEEIRKLANRIAKSAKVCADYYGQFLEADREYGRAFAQAYMAHEGAQAEKRYAAELATFTQRERRDIADTAYRYSDRLSKALQSELLAYQSLNKSLLAQYQVAGVGER